MSVCLSGNQPERTNAYLHIGLINNMPDAALEATERQFLMLLDSAAKEVSVRVSLYSLPDVPRNEWGKRHIKNFYSDIESLWDSQLDGLIVTGREPRTPNLRDEPYWGNLTRVIEWAKFNTSSTILSCLAAHAALLHMDGISRRKSNDKRFGVLECSRLSDHRLLAGVPTGFKVPHSRWNDIPEDELIECGYSVLARTQNAGVDTFVKRENSLFVFFQGHPEYESDTLLLEYRRDIGRYLRRETDAYPSMPQTYFEMETANALIALQERAESGREEELLTDVATVLGERRMTSTWRSTATRIYSNWLEYLSVQKGRRFHHRSAEHRLDAFA